MLDKDAIRQLIRDVIAEEVKFLKAGATPAPATSIRIASNADLAAFARHVLQLAEDSKVRAAIQTGRHPFHLANSTTSPAPHNVPAPRAAPTETQRIDKGVVTEAVIAKLAKGVTRLLMAPGVSITPLARDKAKARNISIERIGQ